MPLHEGRASRSEACKNPHPILVEAPEAVFGKTWSLGSPLEEDRSAHDLAEPSRDADEELPVLVQVHDAARLSLLGEKPMPIEKAVIEKAPADRLEAASKKELEPLIEGRNHSPEHLKPAQVPPKNQGERTCR